MQKINKNIKKCLLIFSLILSVPTNSYLMENNKDKLVNEKKKKPQKNNNNSNKRKFDEIYDKNLKNNYNNFLDEIQNGQGFIKEKNKKFKTNKELDVNKDKNQYLYDEFDSNLYNINIITNKNGDVGGLNFERNMLEVLEIYVRKAQFFLESEIEKALIVAYEYILDDDWLIRAKALSIFIKLFEKNYENAFHNAFSIIKFYFKENMFTDSKVCVTMIELLTELVKRKNLVEYNELAREILNFNIENFNTEGSVIKYNHIDSNFEFCQALEQLLMVFNKKNK